MSDIEEKAGAKENTATFIYDSSSDELPPYVSASSSHGFFASLRNMLTAMRHFEAVMDRKFGVEAHGPARILPEERDPAYNKWSNQAIMALMWASGTMNLSCFTSGILGWELGLDLTQTILIIIFGSLLGSAVTVCISTNSMPVKPLLTYSKGWCATMGPGTGLRQVSSQRSLRD